MPFIVWTDHKNLEYIRSAKRLNARQARWALFFGRFEFSISFRPSSKNRKPDALSRQFCSSGGPSTTENILPQRCVVGAATWGVEQAVRRALFHVTRPARTPEGTLFVPEVVRPAVLRWGHSSKLMAHPGIRGTLAAISQHFWWPTRERNVRHIVASCHVCAQTKSSNSPPAGLLRHLPIPSCPWSHIALDFVTGLPLSAGNTVILTVVDRFSKAAHFIPLPKLPSARETAQVMVDHVFKIHGLPSDTVSDRGPQFASQFWREFCRQIGASPALSSGFYPQTERTNQILGRMLRSLTSCTPATWCDQLSWAEYAHNSLPSSTTGLSPFECCLGYKPPLFTSQVSQSSVPSVETFIQRCKRTWRRVRSALCRTRARTRRAVNRHWVKAPRYVCGQKVWLSTRNLPIQESSRKLMPRFVGPFPIVKVLSPVCDQTQIVPSVAPCSPCLSRVLRQICNLRSHPPLPPPPPINEEASIYRVRKLLDVRP